MTDEATIKDLRAQLAEAHFIIEKRTRSLKMAHSHLENYENYIEELETKTGAPIPGHRNELGVTKQQHITRITAKKVQIMERRVKVKELIKMEMSLANMASQLGVSVGTISEDRRIIKNAD